ncbi:tannase/feruloyl esterase family alpha/beta hydrolase [Ramlibacter sp. G-1-2-2]|uniref:Tannase/feruloyl esterase family alpha/beta hydrolase n=1 Tax=Ramlibacter agri TaxID=2728837 RepID=A0A848GYL6_9BURK|nr:tannase/feruloyl esterase family alpha/beta hydrolase [Ramlibacter agri]NML43257.1 tannase/feruloyl esterase family alpha/beta hydrolase [Ramlibacter agri]
MKLLGICSLALSAALLAGCASQPAARAPLACDDGIQAAFHPDAQTRVIAVRRIAKGTPITAVDSQKPVVAARDMCLVKLLVGPGATAEKDANARSYTEGIGMEVWLPDGWNERIRNYGGGGWVGGGHRYPDKIGSKVPAIAIANMGFASGTHDGGQPWYQDASFAFLSSGAVNLESMQDMSRRAMYEQAVKTRSLVEAYYGHAPRYAYYDGHSTGGRQGLKVAQEWPAQYDGYLVAQPAVNASLFGLAALYPQVVMQSDLHISALDKPAATAFARKVSVATARAVASCDKEKLGYLVDAPACAYDPVRDAGMLCAGVAGESVTGTNADAASCMSVAEARALDKIWYGPTTDGSYDPGQTRDGRAGVVLGPKQLWWGHMRGTNITGGITNARTDILALTMQDVRYAADASANSDAPIVNASTQERNRWHELNYATYAQAMQRVPTIAFLREHLADKADLSGVRDDGRKMILWNGWADDAIPPAGATHYYESVVAWAGGEAQVQRFLRMYNIPGMAHSSQGRGYTVAGANDTIAMPALPGDNNQLPTREQDQMFSALQDWVEGGTAPGTIVITSRDKGTTFPICVYPKKATWNGTGPARSASSYSCL